MSSQLEAKTDLGLCLFCAAALRPGRKSFCCVACEELYQFKDQLPATTQPRSFESTAKKFSYLDQDNYKHKYVFSENNMLFHIEGIHCSSCVHLLEQLPRFSSDIIEARINYGDSTLSVSQTQAGSWARVAAIISELGYVPSPLCPLEDPKIQNEKENRDFVKRLAVAGACAGNMMLFVVPIYAGLQGNWARIFSWISFGLFMPILFYSAKPFYQGAWNFLKYRSINIDLPIVVAFLSGFALSTYNLFRNEGPIYYDSTASFLFLILASRYLLRRVQQKYLSAIVLAQMVSPEVEIGEALTVYQGQKIPVDGTLLSPSAEIDLSLFNGESLPQIYQNGMQVFAGTTLLSPQASIRVEKINSATRLGQLMAMLRTEGLKKAAFTGLTDRLAQGLIVTVFSIALLYFAIHAKDHLQEALQRSLALIVVACPCALAFGTPLAYGLAIKKARGLGIIIKSGEVFEKVLKIKNIFFDKTGTLTEGTLNLVSRGAPMVSLPEKRIILALEASSYHPIAFALRRAWQGLQDLPKIENHQEILGQGIVGTINGDHYSLLTAPGMDGLPGLTVKLKKNGMSLALLHFEDQLRPDSAVVLEQLKDFHLSLLSGDRKAEVAAIAGQCGLSAVDCHAELSPEEKLRLVHGHKNVCMIGDGANDSLALKAADVGIAVKGSVDLSLSSADVYFTRGGLSPLLDLLSIAKQTRKTIYRNLFISFTYNFIGGSLALGGFISPMVAAILMPISSVLLVISSLEGTR